MKFSVHTTTRYALHSRHSCRSGTPNPGRAPQPDGTIAYWMAGPSRYRY